MISGSVFREIEESCWSAERRIADMDGMRITTQVLSPMPELLSYWMAPEDTAELGRYVNHDIAEMVAQAPARFRGLGMVPLQAPDRAARELEGVMREHGLDGVEIGTNVAGRPVGDPMFEPFFAAAEELGALVFVHPLRAAGRDQLVGPPGLEQVVAFPCETALAIASLITGGVLHRHPRLKLVFSHGGGAFAQVLPRLQHAWTLLPALQEATGAAPETLARRLHFDSLVYSPLALRFLLDTFGPERIVLGTDYPFIILDKTPVASAEAARLAREDLQAVCSLNLRRLLAPR
jgi:aminocarboxymuconate-semialdehyde decarboxylase